MFHSIHSSHTSHAKWAGKTVSVVLAPADRPQVTREELESLFARELGRMCPFAH